MVALFCGLIKLWACRSYYPLEQKSLLRGGTGPPRELLEMIFQRLPSKIEDGIHLIRSARILIIYYACSPIWGYWI